MTIRGKGFGFERDVTAGTLSIKVAGTEVWKASTTAITEVVAAGGPGGTLTGGLTVSTGDVKITAGNLRLGVISAFATTEPTSAVVMKQGTAPAGAITTSAGIFTDGTVLKKIIAAGTVSNIET